VTPPRNDGSDIPAVSPPAPPSRKHLKGDWLENAVKAKKSDKELTTLITATHDVFHEIKEKCKPGEKH